MSCHVTCDIRPSASLCVLNEAGRPGDEAIATKHIVKSPSIGMYRRVRIIRAWARFHNLAVKRGVGLLIRTSMCKGI